MKWNSKSFCEGKTDFVSDFLNYFKVEPEGTSALAAGSRVLFLETVRRSNAACQNGDYALAATLYTEALALDPLSHVLFSNRSAARLKMGMFALALQDAVRATELNPEWPKVQYPTLKSFLVSNPWNIWCWKSIRVSWIWKLLQNWLQILKSVVF